MSWTVADVMTRDVVAVGPGAGFKECVRLLRVHGISALPVITKDRKVLGIVSEADLLAKEEQRPSRVGGLLRSRQTRPASARVASAFMTSPVIAIAPEASVRRAAQIMHMQRVKRLPVIDVEGRLVGIVSRPDLLKTFMRSDESIRREVADQVLKKTLFIDPKDVGVEV